MNSTVSAAEVVFLPEINEGQYLVFFWFELHNISTVKYFWAEHVSRFVDVYSTYNK